MRHEPPGRGVVPAGVVVVKAGVGVKLLARVGKSRQRRVHRVAEGAVVDDELFRTASADLPLGEFSLLQDGSQLVVSYTAFTTIEGDTFPWDGAIDLNDLNAVRSHFGEQQYPGMPGDAFPFDGVIDLQDLNAVRNHFGTVGGARAAPEPEA